MDWKELFKANILNGGQDYIKSGAVHDYVVNGDIVTADVSGLEEFHVKINVAGGNVGDMACSCPYAKAGSNCKHMAAVLFTWEENSKVEESDSVDTVVEPEVVTDNSATKAEPEKKTEKEEPIPVVTPIPVQEAVEKVDVKEETKVEQKAETTEKPSNVSATSVDNTPSEVAPEEVEHVKAEYITSFTVNYDGRIQLLIDVNTFFAYALQQNRVALVRSVTIKNTSEEDMENLAIRIRSDVDMIDPYIDTLDVLPAGEEHCFKNLKIRVHGNFLASLTERISCNLYVSVTQKTEELATKSEEIAVLAYDQWPGFPRYYPDLLAAYITPNHPVVTTLIQSATKYLEKWTGSPSLNGYQSGDPNRIISMAGAAYAAIQEKNIVYAEPPASFEDMGQRVRLADEIMNTRFGTCMDMTLLYAACLEAMGLNALLIMMDGHIFAGTWLVDDSFPDPWTDDPSQIEKRVADGVNEIIVVECTAMCAGKTRSFDDARAMADSEVNSYNEFEFTIDLTRARRSGIRPLPVRIKGDNGYTIEHEDRSEKDVTAAPTANANIIDIYDGEELEAKVTKQTQWERKLLDLSMRNMLINMRVTGSVIPILTSDLSGIEDALSEGTEYELLHRPAEWDIHEIDAASNETVNDLGPYAELIALEAKHHRLHAWMSEKELTKLLTKMYRSAKSSMEENGASTLYLTLGQLRWFDGIKTKKVHYAPIVLIPIDIIRKSASKGFVIRERDDDAQVNITLLEFLKQNYNIEITGLNPVPTDDHGIDIEKIFAIVRHAVMNQKMWDVVETAFIGNFSFSQFVMWNDMHSRADLLERNKVVHALMEGAIDWDCSIPENVDTDDAYLPVSVDASQLRAINMAANDVSFVLHGPPGTGKSQTITAMIANALTKGKTVLFVAEKMAALEVVQKRLASLGIEDFCLELHSNKAIKKNVLDQLKRGMDIKVWGMSTEYDQKINDIHAMRAELDAYAKKLHEKRPFGMSVRELIDVYESIPEQKASFRPDREFIASATQSDLANRRSLLERLIAAGKMIGHPKGHVFSVVGQTEYSQSLRMRLEDVLYDYEKSIKAFVDSADEFAHVSGENGACTKSEWFDLLGYATSIIKGEEIPAFLMSGNAIDDAFKAPALYLSKRAVYENQKAAFFGKYKESILSIDLSIFVQKYAEAGKKLFGKAKAIEAVNAELQQYANVPVSQEQLASISAEIQQYKQVVSEYESAKSALPAYWNEYINESTTIENLNAMQADWSAQLAGIAKYSDKLGELKSKGNYSECIEKAKSFIALKDTMDQKESAVVELLLLTVKDNNEDWISGKKELINLLDKHSSELRDWISYQEIRTECEKAGLSDICGLYTDGLDHDAVIPTYFKTVYKALIWSVIESEPVLNKFTGNSFNERIRQYKKLEQEFIDLTKQEMYYKLTHNLPTGYESVEVSRELAILRKAISSGGRGMSIRTLFDQIPHVLTKLCPCLLMSPISVAQYLSVDNDQFDIVIFDEASQLPTCKAVGVLARGKNAVIVGDPNQMPPTSFFAGSMIDEDNLDIEDLDSILDDCLALGMPESHLQWHYRSRHESLIAFSNMEYYENSMLTFPSVNDRERRVKLCTVNGTFNRKKGRVNEEEGRAVVKEILRRYKKPELKSQTIGIVTFNISQQGLIEDMLQEEYRKDADFDKWANEREEALFVKNLENVQGDERDVILFSIGFGPDEDGKLSLNFGPLNKEGGWKRLNVAVSRARSEMIVFSSMTPEMIDLNRTKAKGVEGLRAFIEFADKGRLGGNNYGVGLKAKGIMQQICSAIEETGLKVQRDVGHSDFKIDIAVVNPYDEDEYLLGIMLDGDTYKRSANTKDREISQIGVLGGLGWRLHRIWTMDWWDSKDKELSVLMNIIEEQKEAARIAFEEGKEKDAGPESEEIIKREAKEEEKPKRKKEKKETDANTSFDTHERFSPLIPHQESRDELSSFMHKKQEEIIDYLNSPESITSYGLAEFLPADVMADDPMSPAEFMSKEKEEEILPLLAEIVFAEVPISFDRVVKKILRAYQIGRSSAGLIEAVDRLMKNLNVKTNKQNGIKFYWSPDQNPDTYVYYRVDAECDDKRAMNEISQQEMKNAVCITLQNSGAMDKDALVRETVRTMGYGRSGAAIVEAIERGIKYGKRTGEIVVNEDKLLDLRIRQ